MNSYNFKNRKGSTPLDQDQLIGIKFPHVTTMGELDELEDRNIQEGLDWLNHQKNKDYLSIQFINLLHKKLFGDVWKWAGSYRKSMVNLSKISHYNIGPELQNLFEDVKVWIQHQSMTWDEISAEFHHRLVSIHPFPNGNGRTARILTEHLQKQNMQPITSWKCSLQKSPQLRRNLYIQALQEADTGNYLSLIEFISEKLP